MMANNIRNEIAGIIAETARNNSYESKGFVPQCKLDNIITEKAVRDIAPTLSLQSDLVKVTAILLHITDSDPASCLSALYESGLTDNFLPVVYDESAKKLASGKGDNPRPFNTLLEVHQCQKFVENQWYFHLQTFGNDKGGEHEHLVLDARCILPVVDCGDDVYSGSFGDVYRIKLHHDYIKISPVPTEKNNPMLALKKLTSVDIKTAFKQEEEALVRIKRLHHKHLVKLIDSFKKGRDYFFLFPWAAGGDLNSLWKKYDIGDNPEQPDNRSPEMMHWLLIQTRGIVSAINAMHNLPDTSADSEENGRHGDIRSQNILLFFDGPETEPPWRGNLCIADVGLSRFHEKITDKRQDPTTTKGVFLEYAPPEIRPSRDGRRKPRSRKYDIWSLGCLFHDLIAWVLFGVRGVERFHNERQSDGSLSSQFYTWEMSRDTYKINPKVKDSISQIRKYLKSYDRETWLWELTNIVEKDLLQINETKRIDSEDLDKKLIGMLKKEGYSADGGREDRSTGEGSGAAVVGKAISGTNRKDKKGRNKGGLCKNAVS